MKFLSGGFRRKAATMFLIAAAVSTFRAESAPLAPAPKKFRIYMVLWRGETQAEKGFKNYLIARGIARPSDFTILNCDKKRSRLPGFIKKIQRDRPDLVYAFGTTVTLALAGARGKVVPEKHITDIPIVFSIVADPRGANLVDKNMLSGRNVTGVSHLTPYKNQMDAMKSMLPVKRLGVVYNSREKNALLAVRQLRKFARRENIVLVEEAVRSRGSGGPGLAALRLSLRRLADKKPDLVYLPSDSFIISNAGTVVNVLHSLGIPTFSATEGPIRKHGALFGLVSPYFNVGRFAGHKAEKILVGGESPGAIPAGTLKRFSFLIHMGASRGLKKYPPISLFEFAEILPGR